ncbi:MAG: [Fe-Fe] hydrogenase large subunit C-terminal domain-containing protein [Oscillospiraceae bacterium]
MKQFDSKIQKINHELMKSIISYSLDGKYDKCDKFLMDNIEKFTEKNGLSSCCIYKEEAVMRERINLLCAKKNSENITDIIKPACEDCSAGGYIVTDACKNCLNQKCALVCENHAILFDLNGKAVINKKLCSECGKCISQCQYNAILSLKRPCENSCSLKALTVNDKKIAVINNDKCISCGMCVLSCPNGAVSEKSFIAKAAEIIYEGSKKNKYTVYALVDPSFIHQYPECKPSQFMNAVKETGFNEVSVFYEYIEKTAYMQAGELVDKGFVISKYCPAFINYLNIHFSGISENITEIDSPVIEAANEIKNKNSNSRIVFIAPCSARKKEFLNNNLIDCVITFEELDAFFDALNIKPEEMPADTEYDELTEKNKFEGSFSELLSDALNNKGIGNLRYRSGFYSGIDECRTALLKSSKKVSINTFIDASICSNGCINGSGCINKK